jgi:catechol 2,3-dioxygenase-like lactoylglutathione lyase family enzyme
LAAGGKAEQVDAMRRWLLEVGVVSPGVGCDQGRRSCRANGEQPEHYFKERHSTDEIHESPRLNPHGTIQLLSLRAVAGRFPFGSGALRSEVSVVLPAVHFEHLQPRIRLRAWGDQPYYSLEWLSKRELKLDRELAKRGGMTSVKRLHVKSMARSLRFYVDALGFGLEWKYQFARGQPRIAQISIEGQHIYLSEYPGDGESQTTVEFVLTELDRVHKSLAQSGIEMVFTRGRPTLTNAISALDPDRNRLQFKKGERRFPERAASLTKSACAETAGEVIKD